MKKIVLSLTIILFSVLAAQAQILPTFKLGIKGALGFSSLSSDSKILNSNNKTGFQLGAWGRFGVAGFHIQPEAYYASKKVGLTYTENGKEEGEATFKSLDVPVLLGTKIGIGPVGFRIQAGPVFTFVQDSDIKLSTAFKTSEYKKNSTGVIGGIGVDISSLTVDLRYEHGLSNLSKNDSDGQKIRMWTIGVGYAIF